MTYMFAWQRHDGNFVSTVTIALDNSRLRIVASGKYVVATSSKDDVMIIVTE